MQKYIKRDTKYLSVKGDSHPTHGAPSSARYVPYLAEVLVFYLERLFHLSVSSGPQTYLASTHCHSLYHTTLDQLRLPNGSAFIGSSPSFLGFPRSMILAAITFFLACWPSCTNPLVLVHRFPVTRSDFVARIESLLMVSSA